MKTKLRAIVSKLSSFTEIFLSVLILVGIALASVEAFRMLFHLFPSVGGDTDMLPLFDSFLSYTIQLIIGVEFVKMIAKHTPASAVEVLLIVTAKRLIIDTNNSIEILLGVIAIALLFGIRKFFFLPKKIPIDSSLIFDACISAENFCRVTGITLPNHMGITIGQIIENEMKEQKIPLTEISQIILDHHVFKIVELSTSGDIIKLQVSKQSDNTEKKGITSYVRNYF